jgi:hypothetical protein
VGSREAVFALRDVVAVVIIVVLTCGNALVGVTGFEPATSSSQSTPARAI